VHDLLKQFLKEFFRTIYVVWTAPADQALDLMTVLVVQILYVLIVFLTLRWMWRKIWK
jgi:hypothetical protein